MARVETHFLGGLRHWGNWEIADIGVLYFVRDSAGVQLRKVALLQSKRLYPATGAVEEETFSDYQAGFSRLADPESLSRSLSLSTTYEFSTECRYGAIQAASDQVQAIDKFQEANSLRVYYQLYNPWEVPHRRVVPDVSWTAPSGSPLLGVRVLPAEVVHAVLAGKPANYRPTLNDLASSIDGFTELGWTLEDFIANELVECREGDVYESESEMRIRNLFFRRSGAIAAAISVMVEAPSVVA